MSYFISTTLENVSFEEAIEKLTANLKEQGFGVLTDIDIQATFKAKLDVDFKKYRILGACNPNFAIKAISAEDKIGVFLPCNVVVTENSNGQVEIAAVDPIASMISVGNENLEALAADVRERLTTAVKTL
ncbi:MAG: DUF302 domain-containing protein [Bacteroidetes bacterium]|uniref:DUF302 domain-containing protein n=1 Tax=Phaeocystidibacter marisrubri TaxID=1577780 RepID=A0A6L3ZGH7_9FLAO|nr:DUF302 domain-containing protein [Phaeocystidibacter marisrubri]KAB2816454.1 DUF302 domain-containing protein [Phaeocystidibacter marisrubri]TNE26716.1 MAG: DUF302 domain-containing protein [Bacteroidota bacterium]GGH69137.1 hypothetical protein GCM10011318_09860 [Phaeocystidibacter marisrubri]